MLITDSKEIAKRAKGFRSFGNNFNLAYNYRMPELHGAIGQVRLKKLDRENEIRIRNAKHLQKNLNGLKGIKPQKPRETTKVVYCNFVIRYFEEEPGVSREKFVGAVQAEGMALPHTYYPLYRHPSFRNRNAYGKNCPFTCPFYKEIGR